MTRKKSTYTKSSHNRPSAKYATACAPWLCLVLFLIICRYMSELRSVRVTMLHPDACRPLSGASLEGEQQLAEAWSLWQQRKGHDVSAQLLPFLESDDLSVRRFAVRALGRLENPIAVKAITQLQSKQNLHSATAQTVDQTTIQMALARIQTRSLKGQDRLETFSRAVGIPWTDLVEKSKTINGKLRSSAGKGTIEDHILDEVVDMLCHMQRSGEPIHNVAADLTLNPIQKLRVKGAALPPSKEAELILDYAMSLKAINSDGADISDYLCELGNDAIAPVLKRLKNMKKHPQQYENTSGYSELFQAAADLGDARALTYLQYFEKYPDPQKWIPHYAHDARILLLQRVARKYRLPPSTFM